jgi:hypothetical protein
MEPVKLKDYAARGLLAVRDAGYGPPGVPAALPAPKGRTSKPQRGRMNGVETRYSQRLEYRKRAGEVAWHVFEGIKFRLADKTWYTPDFLVMLADGRLEIHETKAQFIEDDAAVKLKVTSEMYWMFPVILVKEVKSNVFLLKSLDRR